MKLVVFELAKRKGLCHAYIDKLQLEVKEIEKQGANQFWCEQYNERKTYTTNDNGLVLPWLLKLTPVEPTLPHKLERSSDTPDIDVDCLPKARDEIKTFARQKYGEGNTSSVGTWMAYKFKSSLQDAARGLGGTDEEMKATRALTKQLPDDVDDLKDGGYAPCTACGTKHNTIRCPKCGSEDVDGTTIGKLMAEFDILRTFKGISEKNAKIVDMAVRMVGKIKNAGKHAGGIIITNQKLLGNVPMSLSKGTDGSAQWTSQWTEGRNTQLSKLGYVKWDLLGLLTLQYIHEACKLIHKTRGIKFNHIPWKDNDPEINSLGWYTNAAGERCNVPMDDPEVFAMINDLKVETVFQFETDVQKGVLSNGVRNYYDLQVFNAMGHPGPIAFIPEYVKRRDDKKRRWMADEHPAIAAELQDTHGIIVYQEQLADLWRKFAGFTAPEAEAARKAVAKKWVEKLKPIKEKWIVGASKQLGPAWAEEMWTRMQTFGRYAFNRSHSCAYILVAYWCAWLKVHFPQEWWASVMSACDADRVPKYMNTARLENVVFGPISVDYLTERFSVNPQNFEITLGLCGIKGMGKSAARLEGSRTYADIDEFITIHGKSKLIMEPLIKLGAFKKLHPNLQATWEWYKYKYCTGPEITLRRAEIRRQLLAEKWPEARIKSERDRQIEQFKSNYPKRKIPAKVLDWKPVVDDSRDAVMSLFQDDFVLKQRLEFEKQYLGYYWHSPLDLYETTGGKTIKAAKESKRAKIEVVTEKLSLAKTKTGSRMGRLTVSDGLSDCTIILWSDQLEILEPYLKDDCVGLCIDCTYDKERNSFTLARGTIPIPLRRK